MPWFRSDITRLYSHRKPMTSKIESARSRGSGEVICSLLFHVVLHSVAGRSLALYDVEMAAQRWGLLGEAGYGR
jgi:hypothetical protein